jgi:pimeloyl-ACP methyl ester carboxylesterase
VYRDRLKVYPDVAHAVLWECPDRVAEDTTAFLSSLD